jgi:hypothetical protein
MKKVLTKKKVCCSLEKDSIFSIKITLKSAE